MAYDKNLDKCIWNENVTVGQCRFEIGIYSYNGSQKKVNISRVAIAKDGERFVKLGRLTKEELEAIQPVLEKAKAQL